MTPPHDTRHDTIRSQLYHGYLQELGIPREGQGVVLPQEGEQVLRVASREAVQQQMREVDQRSRPRLRRVPR
jgi:hypothetical protein